MTTRDEQIKKYRDMRDEANRKLKELAQEGFAESGDAKISRKKTYKYRQNEEFALAYNVRMQGFKGQQGGTHYVTLFTGTRGECVDAIPGIVKDLQELYDAVKGECNFV